MKKVSNVIFFCSVIILCIFFAASPSVGAGIVLFSTMFGVLSSQMAANGKWHMFIFDIMSYIIYIYVSLKAAYFGEVVLSTIVIIINLFCLTEWKKYQNADIIIINTINKKEIKFVIFVAMIMFFTYSALLYMANTKFVLINAFATIFYLLGSYFCYRRSILQFYSWIIYEIAFIILWLFSALSGSIENAMFLVGGLSELIFGVVGIYNWKKYQRKQSRIQFIKLSLCKKSKWEFVERGIFNDK